MQTAQLVDAETDAGQLLPADRAVAAAQALPLLATYFADAPSWALAAQAQLAEADPGTEELAAFLRMRVALAAMVRPGSWIRPAGESPARVGTGAPGSRPRFVVERRRAERGVESLFGGSKSAGRSVMRTLQPRQTYSGRAEPVMSRRRPRLAGLDPVMACQVFPGYGRRHVLKVWSGTGEARLPVPGVGQETAGISRW